MTLVRPERSHIGWGTLGQLSLLAVGLGVDLVLWGFDPAMVTGGSIPIALVVVSGIAVFGFLYFRGRWPRATFLAAWSYCLVWGALLPFYQPFTALLISLYHVARHLPGREARWFLLLAVIPPVINTRDAGAFLGSGVTGILLVGTIWCVILGIPWAAGRWGRRAAEAARWREEKLAAEAALAVQNERLTLARELHDIVSHSVGSIILQAAGARHAAAADQAKMLHTLETIQTSGTRAMHELRELLGMLNAAAEAGSPGVPNHVGLAGVASLLDATRASGVSVTLHESGTPGQLSAVADHTAYRLVQESLTNAIKHSGENVRVDVDICWEPERIELAVVSASTTNSVAPTPPSGGYGLAGMRYRVASVGGLLESGWESSGTFAVKAQIPFETASDDHRTSSGRLT